MGWDFVAASSVDDATTIFGATRSTWPEDLTLDASGAHWRWNGGSSDVDWKNYIRWAEGRNQILFYTSPACFNILPKRAIAAEQLNEIRSLLNQNIQVAK